MAQIKVGDIEITAITDGSAQFTPELFPGTDAAHIGELIKAAGKSDIETNFNAFLVKTGTATVLIDAGPRDLMGPSSGGLANALEAAGLSTGDITHLVITHIHPDHVAGALTADGQAVFENAQMFIAEADHSFWTDPGNFTTANEMVANWHQIALTLNRAYGERVTPVADSAGIVSGVSLMPLPGHTPGHVGVRIDDGSESFLHVADIVHAQDLQLADPEIAVVFDLDADVARATRKRTLDMLANEQAVFSGGHIIAPKFARLERAGAGYRLTEG